MVRTFNSFTTSDSKATATTYGSHWFLIFHWILPSCKPFLICYSSTLRMSRWSNHWQKLRFNFVRQSAWTKQKDRTVQCEGSIGSKFSASGKFFLCGVNVHAALTSRTTFCMKLTLFDVIVRLRREIPLASWRERTQKAGTDLEWILTDFLLLGRSRDMLPREMFWILTPQSPLSWVYWSLRQDICWLCKPFSRFQLGKFKVLLVKVYLLWKIRPISVKRWKRVWIMRACKDEFFLSLLKRGRGPQDFDSKGSLPTLCQMSEIKTFSQVLHGLKIKN